MAAVKMHARRIARGYALSIAFCLPLSQLVGTQTYIMDRREGVSVLLGPLLLAYGARYLTLAILTPPTFYVVSRWPLTAAVLRRSAAYVLGYVAFSCAFALIRWSLLPPWDESRLGFGPRSLAALWDFAWSTFADILIMYVGIVAVAHAYIYFVRGQRQEIERLGLQRSLAHSELQTLRTQLHPHFLFNTLQGISTLIASDPSRAEAMLNALASMLRTALRHGTADLVPFREELQFVKAYVSLEQMRLGSRLSVEWQIESQSLDALVPQLLLQPLVENAVLHGAASAPDGGFLVLRTAVDHDRLLIRITNSVAESPQRGHGLGLANTKARLQHLYSGDASLEFTIDSSEKYAVASVTLPIFRAHAACSQAHGTLLGEVS
jgi:two-component system LytT family sensor kinase